MEAASDPQFRKWHCMVSVSTLFLIDITCSFSISGAILATTEINTGVIQVLPLPMVRSGNSGQEAKWSTNETQASWFCSFSNSLPSFPPGLAQDPRTSHHKDWSRILRTALTRNPWVSSSSSSWSLLYFTSDLSISLWLSRRSAWSWEANT